MRAGNVFRAVRVMVVLAFAICLVQVCEAGAVSEGKFKISYSEKGRITLQADNAKLSSIVSEVSKKSGVEFRIFGNKDTVVSGSLKDVTLEQFINRIARNWALERSDGSKEKEGRIKRVYLLPRAKVDLSATGNQSSSDGSKKCTLQSFKALEAAEKARQSFSELEREKIESVLVYVIHSLQKAGINRENARSFRAKKYSNPLVKVNDDGELHVLIKLKEMDESNLSELKSQGTRIITTYPSSKMVLAWADADSSERIAELPFVKRIETPDYGWTNAGFNMTEGDADLKADLVRVCGDNELCGDGYGVSVGAISDGVTHLAEAQGTLDLPENVITHNASPEDKDEGTAMLEIVHDLAPEAQLAFDSFLIGDDDNHPQAFIDAVKWLKDTFHAKVIVDDVSFFKQPYFEDGEVAQAVKAAVDDGVIFVTSCGNAAENHWEGDFAGNGAEHPFHQWNPSEIYNFTQVPDGCSIKVYLQWNDPFGSSGNDYNLFLYDDNDNVLAGSMDLQDGDDNPIELAIYTNNTGGVVRVNIAVERNFGEDRKIEMFADIKPEPPETIPLHPFVSTGSIFGHAAVPEVIDVAAIDHADSGQDQTENYSSQGPAEIYFPERETRQKPFISGIDNVKISGAGGFGYTPDGYRFTGTSAAAPHIAAIAALVLSVNPDLEPEDVQNILGATAVNIGVAGHDSQSGWGRADAENAVKAALGIPIQVQEGNDYGLLPPNTQAHTVKHFTSGNWRFEKTEEDHETNPESLSSGETLALATLADSTWSKRADEDRLIGAWLILDAEDVDNGTELSVYTWDGRLLSHCPPTGSGHRQAVIISIPPDEVVKQSPDTPFVLRYNGDGEVKIYKATLRLFYIKKGSETDPLVTGGWHVDPDDPDADSLGKSFDYGDSTPWHITPDFPLSETWDVSGYDISEIKAARFYVTASNIGTAGHQVTLKINGTEIGNLPMVTTEKDSVRTRYIAVPDDKLSAILVTSVNRFILEGDNSYVHRWGVTFDYRLNTAPGITVTAPNAGQHWTVGTSKEINWTANKLSGDVRIELFKNGALESEIANSVPVADGSFNWTIPASLPTGADYEIRITSISDDSILDSSDAFSISQDPVPNIIILAPNGGEIWDGGNSETITWSPENLSGNVKIELYRDGSFDSVIWPETSAASGSYAWSVLASIQAENSYSVRITSLSDSSVYDSSNGPFAI